MIAIIYWIGVIVSFFLLGYICTKTPKEERCSDSEAIGIICVGSLMSWLIPMLTLAKIIVDYIDEKYLNK